MQTQIPENVFTTGCCWVLTHLFIHLTYSEVSPPYHQNAILVVPNFWPNGSLTYLQRLGYTYFH